MERFSIKCRTAPAGDVGPLLPRLDKTVRVLTLHIPALRACPKGLNIDGAVLFDMQADGGVDGVEIFCPITSDFWTGEFQPDINRKYWRLFLEPTRKEVSEPEVEVAIVRRDHLLTVRFAAGPIDAKYAVGPGVVALTGEHELRGFDVGI